MPRPSRATPPARRRGATRPAARAAAREPLSPQRIVDAAFAIVDADGLAALSTRRLGTQLRCEAMSIYHHFPSKQHLLDAMVDRVLDGLPPVDAAAAPIERVRQVCHAYRAMAHRYPAFFAYVATHRLNTPRGVRFIDTMLQLFRDAVHDDALAARYFRAMGYYLMGAGLDETAGYAKGPCAAEPVDDGYIAEHCSALAASARYFARSQWDATFELGLEALLAAIEADAGHRSSASIPPRRR